MKTIILKNKKVMTVWVSTARSGAAIFSAAVLCCLNNGVAAEGYSEGAAKNSVQAVEQGTAASAHSAASAGHAMAASGKATIGASAVPVAASGAALTSAGTASTRSAKGSVNASTQPTNASIGKPLEISDEAIITTPPNVELKSKPEQKAGR